MTTPTRVLIVDDHRMFAESLRRVLTVDSSVDVVATASTASEAMASLERGAPDVALVDYQLPDMDGASLTRMLVAASPSTRVVMLTGDASDAAVVAAIDAGCAGFLDKAETSGAVATAIARVMAGEIIFTPAALAHALREARRPVNRVGADLTPREREVLALLATGLATDEVASELSVSVHTVRTHIQSILEKLHAHSKLEAVAVAFREGLVSVS